MILIRDIKLPIDYSEKELNEQIVRRLGGRKPDRVSLVKKSVDARHKPDVRYIVTVAVDARGEEKILKSATDIQPYETPLSRLSELELPKAKNERNIAIVGSGPAGLFAALTLVEAGVKPLIIERGCAVKERVKKVNDFFDNGRLDLNTNVQFGEGGAGTFSDGKLNTGTSSVYNDIIKGEFVRFGAPNEILYSSKPHIGTDYLQKVVEAMRQYIISRGGSFLFNTTADDFIVKNGCLHALVLQGVNPGVVDCEAAVLAIGHSARDTFRKLYEKGAAIVPKSFSMGVRIEHLQSEINAAQYGVNDSRLPAADYKLSCGLEDGRSCYTFCMCPAGEVVNASSGEGEAVTNGMSYFARNGVNANSAMLVSVTPDDFDGGDPLSGVRFQQKYERLAFRASGGNKLPCQTTGDFLDGRVTAAFGRVIPSVKTGVTSVDLRACLPEFASRGLNSGLLEFDKKIKGFAARDSVLTGVETRSSSPVRILRGENGESNIGRLYPCGEGAGYSGGITSSAVDGIKTAIRILKNL